MKPWWNEIEKGEEEEQEMHFRFIVIVNKSKLTSFGDWAWSISKLYLAEPVSSKSLPASPSRKLVSCTRTPASRKLVTPETLYSESESSPRHSKFLFSVWYLWRREKKCIWRMNNVSDGNRVRLLMQPRFITWRITRTNNSTAKLQHKMNQDGLGKE